MPIGLDVQYELATMPHGKLVDIYRPRPRAAAGALPTVLLWHGIGPDERDVLGPLAREIAGHGLLVLVPDWRSDAPDGGRAHLLDSLEYARGGAAALGGDGDRFVLAGWSAGASAAMGLALHPETAGGWRPAAVVGIASRYDRPARTTGIPVLTDLTAAPDGLPRPVPVTLVHGTADEQIGVAFSHQLLEALTAHHWPARLEEIEGADHAGAMMTVYDPVAGRCRPTDDEKVRAAGRFTARTVAEAAGVSPA